MAAPAGKEPEVTCDSDGWTDVSTKKDRREQRKAAREHERLTKPVTLAPSTFFKNFQFGDGAKGPRLGLSLEDVKAWLSTLECCEADMKPGYIEDCRHLFVKNPFATILPESVPITDDIRPFIDTSRVARVPGEEPVELSVVNVTNLLKPPSPASILDIILYRAPYLHRENKSKGLLIEEDKADWYVVMIKGQDEERELPMKVETLRRNQKDGAPISKEMWNESTEYWSKRVELRF